jgi:hypothetical protein
LDFACSDNPVSREGQNRPAQKAEPSFLKAAKQGLHILIRSKFAALDLGESLKHCRQVARIDLLGFAIIRQREDGSRDVILTFAWQTLERLERLMK